MLLTRTCRGSRSIDKKKQKPSRETAAGELYYCYREQQIYRYKPTLCALLPRPSERAQQRVVLWIAAAAVRLWTTSVYRYMWYTLPCTYADISIYSRNFSAARGDFLSDLYLLIYRSGKKHCHRHQLLWLPGASKFIPARIYFTRVDRYIRCF